MYYLLNRDSLVGQFDIDESQHKISRQLEHIGTSPLPIGFQSIKSWVENRKASKHNSHLREIMNDCGCSTMTGFINVTHAASINDTFWVKSDKEDISWSQVSFYKNPFDEVISKLAFEGLGLYGIKLSSTSPELCTDGSFRKCWIRDDVDNKIYLYKRGSGRARNAGFEPYCEVMGAELAKKILNKNAIEYSLVHLHGELASRCELFSNEQYGYTPISRFPDVINDDLQSLLSFFSDLGSEDIFRKMLVIDALTFNTDRHAGNFGALIENDTQTPVKMAPVFDMNLSMLPYIEREDVDRIGDALERYTPMIGTDFTRVAQTVLTPELRSILISLKGFEFSFRGDERFSEHRVKFMESLINRQIEAILSQEKLYTKDVFIPETRAKQDLIQTPTQDDILADKLWAKHNLSTYFLAYDLEKKEGYTEMVLFLKNVPNKSVRLNLNTGSITALIDDQPINSLELFRQKSLSNALEAVERAYTVESGIEKYAQSERVPSQER